MKILVTGGAGFIGSNFIHYLLKKYPDYYIINLDKLTYAGNLDNLKDVEKNSHYKFIKGDICDRNLVSDVVGDSDAIVNFAAESHVDRSIKDCSKFIKTNIEGVQILLEAARLHNKKRFHQISTDEVFGSLDISDSPSDENSLYNPRNPYSASKAAADHLVKAYFNTYQLPITISYSGNNYGPYQYPEKLIPLFITNILENKKVPVYGNGLARRDWVYVKDHCEAIDIILHKGRIGESYNVGSQNEKTNLEITKAILELLGKGEEMIEFVSDRPGHDMRYALDTQKIERALGWHSKISFEEGLRKTIKWYVDNIKWWQKLKHKD